MDNGFNVHLASNVAHDTYPLNTASDFITPLAEEILTAGEKWEVAVKNIMYPSVVASTTKKDSFDIVEQKLFYGQEVEIAKGEIYKPYEATLELPIYEDYINSLKETDKKIPTKKVNAKFAQYICDTLNENTASKKGIFKFEYKKKQNKFVIHVSYDDVFISFRPTLQHAMGFTQSVFSRGSYWTWNAFNVQFYKKYDVS